MKPQWSSDRNRDADPTVEAAFRNLLGAVDNLRTARIRMDNFDMQAFLDEPTEVTDEFMRVLAMRPGASPELTDYWMRVQRGECQWSEIEIWARPLPPEVAEIKSSDRFIWNWNAEPPAPEPPPQRPRRESGTVGPSDWPDDFDDYPEQRSWLV
ncbi:hypothetical protein [Nocardia carnea]|uniref:hypothetical protein n=1 Tax=Nocardia carnea TaxID=37328 RepID=UPI002458DE04|nr:hypothetical protein [Nocardia carnea]